MPRKKPRNPSSQPPDQTSNLDHVDQHPRHPNFQKTKQVYVPVNRGSDGGGTGSAGGGDPTCCFRCHEPGHVVRDCPRLPPPSPQNNGRRGNQAAVDNSSKGDVIEFTSKINKKIDDVISPLQEYKEEQVQSSHARNDSLHNELEKVNNELKLCRAKNVSLNNELKKANNGLKKVNNELKLSQAKNESLNNELEKANNEFKLSQAKIEGLNSEVKKANNEFKLSQANNESLKIQLNKAIAELKLSQTKNEILNNELTKANSELKLSQAKNESLNNVVNKANNEFKLSQAKNESMKIQLNKAINELKLSQGKNESLNNELERANNELKLSRDKNESLNTQLSKAYNDLELFRTKPAFLRMQLEKKIKELRLSQVENEEIIQDMNKLKQDLENTKKDLISLAFKEDDQFLKLWESNKKIKQLEETNETTFAEMMKLKQEIEKWRKAAKAIASVFVGGAEISSKTPQLESLVLYYSNRAEKHMFSGKMRKALNDCRMASRLDPGFLKVCLTAGNCHLVLGEIDDALHSYKRCLDSGMVCLDRELKIEASDGLQKAEKVINYINQSAELLKHKTFESATQALEVITEALSISCYSEKLLEMKGEALFMKYEEVIQMCEQTLVSDEKNCATTIIGDSNQISDEDQKQSLNLWRWNLMSRSYFHMAKFDLAVVILEKYEKLAPPETKNEGSSSLSAATICELLHSKNAGNEAYKSGKYREAVEHYSNAVKRNVDSRHFTAICLCNRAAAHQALGKFIDAIADCNLAIALDGDYMKATSRRAILHEKIRDYEQAALDFQKLISLLENQNEDKYTKDLVLARQRLSSTNRNMKKGMMLDLNLILGLKGSETSSEIKKAYHKAALTHHPDKAGKFLARNESGADSHVWREIFTIIHKDANKLFKMIGEAYVVLSDTNKRFKYNLEGGRKDDYWN